MKSLLIGILALGSLCAFADVRDRAVLASPMVKAIQNGLYKEQGLKCQATYDESNDLSVNYMTENNRSKFELYLNCGTKDGSNAVIKGVIGDGGQTAVESFKMKKGIN
jgi:hypothetical protein